MFLHVGMGRCGTTALQFFAHDNAERLRQNGLYYPTADEMGRRSPWGRTRGNGIVMARGSRMEPTLIETGFLQMAERRFERLLISSEFFDIFGPHQLGFLRNAGDRHGLTIKPIIYLREQVEWFLSVYANAMQSGQMEKNISDYLHGANRGFADYAKICGNLAQVFDRGNSIVRVYDRSERRRRRHPPRSVAHNRYGVR